MDYASVSSNKFVEKQLSARKVDSLDLLPKDVRKEIWKEAKRLATNDVFGVDHKTDKDGKPIEQGIGSKGNMSQHCIDSYIMEQTQRRKNPEEGYEQTLVRMRKELAECQARRRAERIDDDDD